MQVVRGTGRRQGPAACPRHVTLPGRAAVLLPTVELRRRVQEDRRCRQARERLRAIARLQLKPATAAWARSSAPRPRARPPMALRAGLSRRGSEHWRADRALRARHASRAEADPCPTSTLLRRVRSVRRTCWTSDDARGADRGRKGAAAGGAGRTRTSARTGLSGPRRVAYAGERPLFLTCTVWRLSAEQGAHGPARMAQERRHAGDRRDRGADRHRREHRQIRGQEVLRRDGVQAQLRGGGADRAAAALARRGRHRGHRLYRHGFAGKPRTRTGCCRLCARRPTHDRDQDQRGGLHRPWAWWR